MEHLRLTIWQVWGGALGGLLLIWAVMWVLVGLKFIVSFLTLTIGRVPKS